MMLVCFWGGILFNSTKNRRFFLKYFDVFFMFVFGFFSSFHTPLLYPVELCVCLNKTTSCFHFFVLFFSQLLFFSFFFNFFFFSQLIEWD